MPVNQNHEEVLKIDAELKRLSGVLIGCPEIAADARQDAWLAATESIAIPRSPLKGWLSRAMFFRAMHRKRADANQRRFEAHAHDPRLSELTPADILERSEIRLQIIRAVASLESPYCRTITLMFFESLSVEEVARAMGVPAETVRTRTKRGLKRLRQRLDAEFGGRKIWALPLAPLGFGFSTALPASAVTKTTVFKGALFMSGKAKLSMAVGFVLLVVATVLHFTQGEVDSTLDSIKNEEKLLANQTPRRGNTLEADKRESEVIPKSSGNEEIEESLAEPELRTNFGEIAGTLRLTVTYGENGPPAVDIPINILPFGVVNPFFREAQFRTDRDGKLEVKAHPTGGGLVTSDLGGAKRIQVKAGETANVTFVIPPGLKIVGTVLDEYGSTVSGAEIFCGDLGATVGGESVTESDRNGRFEVANFGFDSIGSICARSPGVLPSAQTMIFPSKGSTKEITLTLGPPAGKVVLKIMDADGIGQAHARCMAGERNFGQFTLATGEKAMPFGRTEEFTDDSGKLILHSVSSGTLKLTVRAKGFAPKEDAVQVIAGQTVHHRIMLSKGGVVQGTVSGSNGLPIGGAAVSIGEYGAIGGHYMRTNKLGVFRFEHVGVGNQNIAAEKDELGETKGKILVLADDTITHDIHLKSKDGVIRGEILDDSGNPIGGMIVSAEANVIVDNRITFSGGQATTGKNGQFVIEHMDESVSHYSVNVRNKGTDIALYTQADVKPGPKPLRIRIPRASIGIGMITGIVISPTSEPVAGANLNAIRRSGPLRNISDTKHTDKDGRFTFDGLPPGTYKFNIRSASFGHQRSEEFTVKDDQVLDVGNIQLKEAGRFNITTSGLEETSGLRIWAKNLDTRTTTVIKISGKTSLSQPMTGGRYHLLLRGDGIAGHSVTAKLESGEAKDVHFEVIAGRKFHFSFKSESSENKIESLTFSLLNSAGVVLQDGTKQRYLTQPLAVNLMIADGAHTLKILSRDGRKGSFHLTPQSPESQILALK